MAGGRGKTDEGGVPDVTYELLIGDVRTRLDEPVTKEWLAAKGAIFHDVWRFYLPACELHVSFSPTGGMWLARLNQEDERYEYLNISDSVPTKRQVRRLVSALEGK